MKKHLQVGFTFIELIIVFAIIGVLAAITVPNYRQYLGEAKQGACLSEAKKYSNQVYLTINDPNSNALPLAPVVKACQSITNATGWTLQTQQQIIAIAKSPSTARIECDIPNGSPCRILP